MNNLYEWLHDDITWCGNECSYTACEINLQNRLTKGGIYSAAMFKDTEICPLSKENRKTTQTDKDIPMRPTWRQGKAYCGDCGRRIPLKIKAHFCHKCGRKIQWQ